LSSGVDFLDRMCQILCMQTRTIIGLPISIFSDSVMKISFITVLTATHVEVVKISKDIHNYRHADTLKGVYIVELDLVKTRKHWIIQDIVHSQKLFLLEKYADFIHHKDILQMLKKYTTQEQEITVLGFLISTLAHTPLSSIDMNQFESQLLTKLGFAEDNDTRSVAKIKDDGHIS